MFNAFGLLAFWWVFWTSLATLIPMKNLVMDHWKTLVTVFSSIQLSSSHHSRWQTSRDSGSSRLTISVSHSRPVAGQHCLPTTNRWSRPSFVPPSHLFVYLQVINASNYLSFLFHDCSRSLLLFVCVCLRFFKGFFFLRTNLVSWPKTSFYKISNLMK